ncbi:SH3 domain-containing protein [Streptomyces griseoaurantiacus]|uniref:SH3 domain-containing protein n=1 Tax=Streptomyces griseoaurantiacus TaxID=68213 RepID=UPI0038186AD1
MATAGALVLGGAVATASTASAAPNSKSCTSKPPAIDVHTYVETSNVKFRTGPSTKYTAKGLLTKGTKVYQPCQKGAWSYIKVTSGAHKGEKGWVAGQYLAIHMVLD